MENVSFSMSLWYTCSPNLLCHGENWNHQSTRLLLCRYRQHYIYSNTEKEHLSHLRQVFDHLHKAKIEPKLAKWAFFKAQILYLGLLLSQEGISSLPEKLDTMKSMPPLRNVKHLRQFLGLTGFYRNHITCYANITHTWIHLLRKDA